jgi:hypothetical protein
MTTNKQTIEFNLDTDDIRTLHGHNGKVVGKEKECYVVGYTERGNIYIVTAIIRPSHLRSAEVRFDKGVAGDYMCFYTSGNGLYSMIAGHDDMIRQGTAHYPRESYNNGMWYFDTLEQVVESLKNMYNTQKNNLLTRLNEIEEFVSNISVENLILLRNS